ncbi:MAG: ClpXP protease specificity-enhancing factor [Betaproteobacteria bacterium]|nr:ClpXP protease specificity-enhancing factor [Betaproteobacteria bacterium]MBI2960375.1 ClpXP protease specificity-enhancing factor [Betaproteobacteria bacterium]
MSEPTSTKPYLLRAIYEWCVDNGLTPYVSVVVDANTRVPMEYVRDGEIVLNIGPLATSRMQMGNEAIKCTARFSGVARELSIPVSAVTAIYARENGHGMSFEVEAKADSPAAGEAATPPGAEPTPGSAVEPPGPRRPSGGKPTLRRIK